MLVALMIWGLLAFTYNNTKQFMSTTTTIPLNDKKTINGWAMFDWANSAFALVITAAIFPGYFTSCLLYTSPSPRDRTRSRMPSSA